MKEWLLALKVLSSQALTDRKMFGRDETKGLSDDSMINLILDLYNPMQPSTLLDRALTELIQNLMEGIMYDMHIQFIQRKNYQAQIQSEKGFKQYRKKEETLT
jgi:hypothetical protein